MHNKYDILQDYDETDEEEVAKQWQDFEVAYNETAQEVLGYKKKGQKPWFSKESWEVVEERKQLKNTIKLTKSDRIKQNYMDKYRCKDKEVKKSMRQDKRKWVDHLAMEAEEEHVMEELKKCMTVQKPSVMTNVRQQMQ